MNCYMRNQWVLLLGFIFIFSNCNQDKGNLDASFLHHFTNKMLEISMEDIYSPPVASRVFVYPNLVCYEVMLNAQGKSIMNQLDSSWNKGLTLDTTNVNYSIAAIQAYCVVAKKLVFSEFMVDSMMTELKIKISKYPTKVQKKSLDFGDVVGTKMIDWIKKDNYAYVKSASQYTMPQTDSTWIITPPNFDKALEPNWKSLRFILLDSLRQFYPPRPPVFSTIKESEFYNEALKVYQEGIKQDEEHHSIAKFWDCNPNEYFTSGHNTYFTHRLSPAGHWLNIAKERCLEGKLDFYNSSKVYASVSIAIFDGIISCWNAKFSEQLVRPITYINRNIDLKWTPFIQTPPFPEYTSGHSVISGASSTVLIHYFGDKAFTDSTEVQFGIEPRTFNSLTEAADQASISRFYGGIHYLFGLSEGLKQGRSIGKHSVDRLELLSK